MSEIKERSNPQTPIEIALGIDKDGKTTARKLYEFLELAKDGKGQFFTWAKANITGNPYAEKGVDYERFDIDIEGHKTADYWLSANFAKKLSMLGKTEKVEQAMDYFAKEIERQEKRKEGQIMKNNNLIKINSHDVTVKEYQGHRVVTFKDIDIVHERQEGTADRNFRENKDKFIENEDYFRLAKSQNNEIRGLEVPNRGITVITESGYLMLVKSFTDDLAWKVQREFVNTYFEGEINMDKKNQFRVIEDELVPVYITDTGEKVVYGTDLHKVLEVKSNYRDWIKNRINDCDAIENEDFESFAKNLAKGGRPQIDHIIKLDIAKEMAMLERNAKGKQVRDYFIKIENKSIETAQNDLIVKDVDLFGDTVIAAQDKDGVIWAGVKWFCDGLGLSEGQTKSERKKLREDLVLSQGGRNLHLPTNGGNQDVLCLQLNYVPLWLAKISITPNMRKNNPELVEKLIKYQLEAKDVLAEAFLPQTASDSLNKKQNKSTASDTEQFTNIPNALNYHGTPVITTIELAKHYKVSNQNILSTLYRYQNYFEEGVHYFLLEPNEEIEFRKANGLNALTKIYLWTVKGVFMFIKVINNEITWKQFKKILDILFERIYGNTTEQKDKEKKIETNNIQQIPDNTEQLKVQNSWYLKNAYKIERICKALDMEIKEFNHLVLAKIQEKYDMGYIGKMYKDKNGNIPEYALDIIACFPELSEIADNVLTEYMLSVVDKFALLKSMTSVK